MSGSNTRHWTITFQDSPDMLAIRADKSRRAAHIAYVRSHPELNIGGEMAMCPMQDFSGAVWHVEAEDKHQVERLILGDPFYVASLRRYKVAANDSAEVSSALTA